MEKDDFLLESYNYNLPNDLIAQNPILPHHNAKLLVYNKGEIQNKIFLDLPELLEKNDILFFNNTKVFKARLPLIEKNVIRHSGFKSIIKNGEILIYKIIDTFHFEALVSDDKNFKAGSKVFFNESYILEVKELTPNGVLFEIQGGEIFDFLRKYAQLPLPPYIKYEKEKEQRYQTHFAKREGSAAAPTASLHFTETLLTKIKEKNINTEFLTLHVGLGTFKPLLNPDITTYKIHSEEVIVPLNIFSKIAKYKKRTSIKNIIPVGTTMIRTLESLPYLYQAIQDKKNIDNKLSLNDEEKKFWEEKIKDLNLNSENTIIKTFSFTEDSISFETQLYIYPGFQFTIIDGLITNFHIPKSSLMIMISARIGKKTLDKIYHYAIKNKYRFYSFGDGMMIRK